MIIGAHFPCTEFSTAGKAATVAIPVPGIRTGDQLLYVILHNAATGLLEPKDPSDFVVANDTITSASVNTSTGFVSGAFTPTHDA
jgi:hypothetical protein